MKGCKQFLWILVSPLLLVLLLPAAHAKDLWLINGDTIEFQGIITTDDGVMLTIPGGVKEVAWDEIDAKSLPPRIRKAHAIDVLAEYDEANTVFAGGSLRKAQQMYEALKVKAAYVLDYLDTDVWLTAQENMAVIEQLEREKEQRKIREAKERDERKKRELIAKGYVQHEGKWIKKEEKERIERAAFRREQKAKGLVYEGGQWVNPDAYYGGMLADMDAEWSLFTNDVVKLKNTTLALFMKETDRVMGESRVGAKSQGTQALIIKVVGAFFALVVGGLAIVVKKLRIALIAGAVVLLAVTFAASGMVSKGHAVFRRVASDPFTLGTAAMIGEDYLAAAPEGKFVDLCNEFIALDKDQEAYRVAMTGDEVPLYESYLAHQPGGLGAAHAKRVVDLHAANPERYDFQLVRAIGTKKAFTEFLAAYPKTRYKSLIIYIRKQAEE